MAEELHEVQLKLVVSAQNLADEALGSLRSTLESLSSLASHIFENMAVAGYAMTTSLEDDFRKFTQIARESLSNLASHAFEPLAVSGHEAIKGLKEEIAGLKREMDGIGRGMKLPVPAGGGGHGGKKGGLFSIEGQMNTLYAGMAMGGAALPIIGVIKEGTKAWADYDHQMRLVNQEMNLGGGQFQKLQNDVIALSNKTGIAASELAKGLYNIAATGGEMTKPEKALERLKLVTEAAKAGNVDLDTVTKALDSVMGAYGSKVGDATKILNQMFAATNNGQMRFGDLAKSVGASATSAAQAGVKYYELAAAQATLTNTGLSAENASQRLNSLIVGIAASSPKAAEEAKNLGIAWGKSGLEAKGLTGVLEDVRQKVGGNTEELKKLFPNQRAYLAVLSLMGNAHDKYIETLGKVKGAHDDLDKAVKKTEGDTKETLDKMKTNVTNAGMELAKAMAPAITSLANHVTQLAQWFQKLSPETKKLIGDIVLGAGAFLSLGSAMFMSLSSIGGFISGVKDVGKALGGMKKALQLKNLKFGTSIYLQIAKLKDAFKNLNLGSKLKGGIDAVKKFGSALKNLNLNFATKIFLQFNKIRDAISRLNIAGRLVGIFNRVKGALEALKIGERIAPILSRLGTIGSGALRMIGVAVRFMMGPWGLLITAVVTGVVLIITHWKQIAAWVKQTFGISLPTNFKEFQKLASDIWKKVAQVFGEVWGAIKKTVLDAWNYIRPTIMDGIKTVQSYWNEVWPKIRELFSDVWSAIKTIFSGTLNWLITLWKDDWNTVKSALKLVWDWIVTSFKVWWDVISGLFKTVLDILTGHWDKAWNDMKQMLGNIWKDITGSFGKLVNDALDFGRNLVKMIADGITGGIHWVESAVSSVAQKIKDFLGFHSPTKEGPARTSDMWAPAFMRMFAEGIENHRDWVEIAVQHVAQTMHDGLSLTKSQALAKVRAMVKTEQFLTKVLPVISNPNYERPDPFLEPESPNAYDRVAGHSSHHHPAPQPSLSFHGRRFAPHQTIIHINIDGRSKKTDQELAEHVVSLISRHIKTHR